jgi:hypothetical protein
MPEFMGKKITREQESARIAYRKALSKAVRATAKDSGWRSVEGCLFQERSDWFVSVSPSVHIFEEITKATVSAKPMVIDPIFWDISGLPENQRAPLSFRFNGAWVCRPPNFAEVEISEQGDVSAIAKHLLMIADEQLERVVKSWTPHEFLSLCLEKSADRHSYLASVVTMLVAMGRDDEALTTCEAAIMKDGMGGFLAPEGTFSEMARNWLEARISARIVN